MELYCTAFVILLHATVTCCCLRILMVAGSPEGAKRHACGSEALLSMQGFDIPREFLTFSKARLSKKMSECKVTVSQVLLL